MNDIEREALAIFRHQHERCAPYRRWCDALGVVADDVERLEQIPFLPIDFFKTERIYCGETEPQTWFESSGTSGGDTSRHFVGSVDRYRKSFMEGFEMFYGKPAQWSFFGLLPLYLERPYSSLAMMVEGLQNENPSKGGFFLDDFEGLRNALSRAVERGEKIFLIGVTFAMVEWAKKYRIELPSGSVVMETGGMKGRGREIYRGELHGLLCEAFGVDKIHSEYGMTEMLSQAYSDGNGIFRASNSMAILGRDLRNPLSVRRSGNNVGINVIDISNVDSCSFIATGDKGNIFHDGSFEILGRIEKQIERGCNMLY